jgi:Rieske Fe-S protein
MPDPSTPFSTLLTGDSSRRALLRGAGLAAVAVGVGAGIAGCAPGSPQSGASPSAGASTPAGSTSPESSPSGDSSPSGASSSPSEEASAPPDGIVVAASDVPEGGGVVVQEKYVVTQPSAGQYKAFSAICTHQGCPVDKVENSEIVCPCHGSHFAIDSGDPVAGPAKEPLPSVEFTKSGDNLVLPK